MFFNYSQMNKKTKKRRKDISLLIAQQHWTLKTNKKEKECCFTTKAVSVFLPLTQPNTHPTFLYIFSLLPPPPSPSPPRPTKDTACFFSYCSKKNFRFSLSFHKKILSWSKSSSSSSACARPGNIFFPSCHYNILNNLFSAAGQMPSRIVATAAEQQSITTKNTELLLQQ